MAKSHHYPATLKHPRTVVQPYTAARSTKISSRPLRSTLPIVARNTKQVAVKNASADDVEMLAAEDEAKDYAKLSEAKGHVMSYEVARDGAETMEVVPLTGDSFIQGLSTVLSIWVQETAKGASTEGETRQVGRFHSSRAPSISIHDYLKRLRKYFFCSDECFVHALVYIDRIGKNDSIMVCDLTVHRLLMIAVMIAAKFHDDEFYANAYYGKAGGMTLREVNVLEVMMLKELNWRTLVPVEEYQLYHDLVCKAFQCA